MKKMLLIAAAAISMVACTNETEVLAPASDQPQEIKLTAVAYRASRVAITDDYVPTTSTIYLSAWQKDGSTYQSYLKNAAFQNKTTNTNLWSGGYYYPTTGELDIMAYTTDAQDAKTPQAVLTGDAATKKISSFSLDFSSDPLKGKTDVLYSNLICGAKKGGENFTLQFNHALAWIIINFSQPVGQKLAGDAIQLQNIMLEGVSLSGKLTIEPQYDTDDKPASYNTVWSDKDTAGNVLFPAFTEVNASNEEVSKVLNFSDASNQDALGVLIVPGAQKRISFEYRTKNGTEIPAGATESVPTYTGWIKYTINLEKAGADWEAGKKYQYNVSISTNEISFFTEVTSWGTKDGEGNPLGGGVIIDQNGN